MVHDTADTESDTEAVQEAATVPEGSGFGGENDLMMRYVFSYTYQHGTSYAHNHWFGGVNICVVDVTQGIADPLWWRWRWWW